MVLGLLRAGVSLDGESMPPGCLMHYCICADKERTVEYIRVFHEYGAEITMGHFEAACCEGNVDAAKCLVALNPALVATSASMRAALRIALKRAHVAPSDASALAEHLFEKGAEPEYDDLWRLIEAGNVQGARIVLARYGPICEQKLLGRLLCQSVELPDSLDHKFFQVAQLLVAHGAKPNAVDPEWIAAIKTAIGNGQIKRGLWLFLRGVTIPVDHQARWRTDCAFKETAGMFLLIKKTCDRYMVLVIAALKDEGSCLFQLPEDVLLSIARLQYYVEEDLEAKAATANDTSAATSLE